MFKTPKSPSKVSISSRPESLRSESIKNSRLGSIFSSSRKDLSTGANQPNAILGLECVPLESATNGHLHLPPQNNRSPLAGPVSISPELAQFMTTVNENAPEVHVIHAPRCLPDIPDLPFGSITLNHNRDEYSGSIFLRILSTRLFWTDRQYRLKVRLGHHQTLTSCVSNANHDIQDWFLLDLSQAEGELIGSNKPFATHEQQAALSIEVHPQPLTEATKKKGFFSGLTRVKSRTSTTKDSATIASQTDVGSEQLVASINIPLVLLALDELETIKNQPLGLRISADERINNLLSLASRARSSGVLGTFYLIDPATQEAAGEITLHAIATPGSFVLSRALGRTVQEARFQGPLTFLRPGRTLYWQRVWAVVLGNELLLYDFQRRDRPQDWALPLSRVVKIEFLPCGTPTISIDNLVEFWLEDGSNMAQYASESKAYLPLQPPTSPSALSTQQNKIYAYADSTEAAGLWINNISMAIWGQPYNTSY